MHEQQLFIITGATKGLGKAIAEEVLKTAEVKVIGTGRSDATILHERYHHVKVDFSELSQVEKVLNEIIPSVNFSTVCLINNAGWIGEIAPLGKLSPEGIAGIMNINWVVPALLMNHFVATYASHKTQKRVVVNISSGAADKSLDGWSGYCASKAALNRLTLVAQEEANLQQSVIKFYSVAPGVVDTDMQEVIRTAQNEDFSAVDHFIQLKNQGLLQAPKDVALKILKMIHSPEQYIDVIQDVRNFD